MEGTSQPDLHDLLQMEDDVPDIASRRAESPERDPNDSSNNLIKINTPAKVLMVGDPVMVKTEQMEDSQKFDRNTDSLSNSAETSGSSNEELADGIHTPSPGTAAAMESLIAGDDLSSASPKLDEVPKLPAPVNFTNSSTITKLAVKPQTSIMTTIRTHQPISIAGKKIMVATQPIQIVKKDGGGGPVFTKFIVKKTSTSVAATSKTPVVFTKNKGLSASPSKSGNLQSGSIVLSPIKGGFKIPISPMKSPIKVSVIPPSNVKKVTTVGKPFTVPLQTTPTQYLQSSQASLNNNTFTIVNGIGGQTNKPFVRQHQISIPVTSKVISANSNQQHMNSSSNRTVQQINVVPNNATIQDSQAMKIQYVQLIPPNSNTLQQPTIRSNQGQPITFTSMSQLNGGNLTLNQPGTSLTFLQSKLQHSSNSNNSHRKAQTVKIAIPNPSTQQVKPQQRLIMPATNLHPIRPNLSALPPGSVLTQGNVPGNVGYAMVPAKYVEQLTKQLNSQSFVQDNLQPSQKSVQGKMGSNGKLKKPCNCTKSQCLKLYCECFANGQFCDECNCINCSNNLEHEAERSKAVKQCLERNPAAFRPKIGRGKDDNRTHQKGCNCKRSGCLKNYCECYEARIPCTSKCKCIGCKNYEETSDRRSLMSLADAAEVRVQQQTAAKTKLSNQIGDSRPTAKTTLSGERLPYTFFTQEVIEATCTCLLAQAEEAEKTNRPMAVAEAMIIEEFGRCVMQIIQSAGKAKVPPLHIH